MHNSVRCWSVGLSMEEKYFTYFPENNFQSTSLLPILVSHSPLFSKVSECSRQSCPAQLSAAKPQRTDPKPWGRQRLLDPPHCGQECSHHELDHRSLSQKAQTDASQPDMGSNGKQITWCIYHQYEEESQTC